MDGLSFSMVCILKTGDCATVAIFFPCRNLMMAIKKHLWTDWNSISSFDPSKISIPFQNLEKKTVSTMPCDNDVSMSFLIISLLIVALNLSHFYLSERERKIEIERFNLKTSTIQSMLKTISHRLKRNSLKIAHPKQIITEKTLVKWPYQRFK